MGGSSCLGTHVGNFAHYLKLPTDKFIPSYFEGLARSYTWIFSLEPSDTYMYF